MSEELHWLKWEECRGVDADLFFPPQGGDVGPAVEVCSRCPVRKACLEYSLVNNIKFGVWGGVPERQRRVMRRDRRRAMLGEDAA